MNVDRIVNELPALHDAAHRLDNAFENLSGIVETVSVLPNTEIQIVSLREELVPAVRASQVIIDISTFSP